MAYLKSFKPGSVIRFTYNHPADRIDEATGDKFKEVLVLHPNWRGKMHGIDMKRLTAAEREVLFAIFDKKTVKGKHRIPLVNDILRRMNPVQEVKNPVSFYYKFVKVFLKNKDAYRMYEGLRILNATTVRQSNVEGSVTNPKPLFHKVETKTQPQTMHGTVKTAKTDPELLKRIAAQMGVKVSDKAGQPLDKKGKK